MKIPEFNEKYANRFRLVELKSYTRSHTGQHVRQFRLEEYCPKIDHWCRVLAPGRWHFAFESKNDKPITDSKLKLDKRFLNDVEALAEGGLIAIIKEKHSTDYYAADTAEQIGQLCVNLVKCRDAQGYYSPPDQPPQPPKRTVEEVADDQSLVAVVKRQWEEYKNAKRYHAEEKEIYANVLLALAGDYVAAYHVINSRGDSEYEGFQIEYLSTPDDLL